LNFNVKNTKAFWIQSCWDLIKSLNMDERKRTFKNIKNSLNFDQYGRTPLHYVQTWFFCQTVWLKIRQTLIQQTIIRGHTPLRTFKFIHILAHWSQLQSLTWPLRILFYLKIPMDEDLFAWFCHNHNYIAINNRHFLQVLHQP
jgi:hypothetical protein